MTEIELKSYKRDEIVEASTLKKKMSNFEFVFVTLFMFKLLNQINLASKTLHKIDIDLGEATSILDRVLIKVSSFRGQDVYNNIKTEARDLAKKWNIDPSFQVKRQRKVKKQFDELALDHQFKDREEYFKVNVYYFTIDIICNKLTERFLAMRTVKNYFDFMEPQNLLKMSKEVILEKCQKMCKKYPHVLSTRFINQFDVLIDLIKEDINIDMTIRQFFEIIIEKYACLEVDFPEVYTAFLLFFTLPVTVANLERSFSKLKILKDCMRSTISEQRLRDLSILTIEYNGASNLDLKELIDRFANAKV